MELGYFTMPLHPPDTDIAQTLQDDLEQSSTNSDIARHG